MKVYRYECKTNVAPLIDVSLCIVLTLMMISPFLNETTQKVDLPVARASQMDDTDNTEVIFTLDGKIYVGEEQIALEDVRALLTPLFENNPDAVAVIKADKSLLYGDVERLIAEVEGAKAARIAISTGKKDTEVAEL
ncbi:MAG: biopolymer transporter ExbD [bacterium]|nr:biopolymer transporter ExbD [bacterium]